MGRAFSRLTRAPGFGAGFFWHFRALNTGEKAERLQRGPCVFHCASQIARNSGESIFESYTRLGAKQRGCKSWFTIAGVSLLFFLQL